MVARIGQISASISQLPVSCRLQIHRIVPGDSPKSQGFTFAYVPFLVDEANQALLITQLTRDRPTVWIDLRGVGLRVKLLS